MIDPEHRWRELCGSLQVEPLMGATIWSALAAAYGERWRHYHTMDHIRALLTLADRQADHVADRATFDLAVFIHDVVYDPSRGDNEARSAAWARERLTGHGIDAARVDQVAHFIAMSRHDAVDVAGVDADSDLALFLDIDLSILAADTPAYETYAGAIRREYALYPDLIYRPGRAKVLQSFLLRPAIYCSTQLRTLWEEKARRNIETELRNLTAP
jgi:predicted metal-dependent HD superfamily phosphohydrolase